MDPKDQKIALLEQENAKLKKKQNKWIESDKTLLGRPRKCRLVTFLDLQDEEFMEKYPTAQIGDEIPDSKPLLHAIGFKRKPTLQEQQARIMAQVAKDLREEMEIGQDETDLLNDFDDDPDVPEIAMAEQMAAIYDSLPYAEADQQSSGTTPHANEEEASSAPQNADDEASSSAS